MKLSCSLQFVLTIATLLLCVSCEERTGPLLGLNANHPPQEWSLSLNTNIETNSFHLAAMFRSSVLSNDVLIIRKYYPGWPQTKVIDMEKVVKQSAHLFISSNDIAQVYKIAVGCRSSCTPGRQYPTRSGYECGFGLGVGNTTINFDQTSLTDKEPIVEATREILRILNTYQPDYK